MEKLHGKGIICDWRDPDVIRVAPVPLYNSFEDCHEFVSRLKEIINKAMTDAYAQLTGKNKTPAPAGQDMSLVPGETVGGKRRKRRKRKTKRRKSKRRKSKRKKSKKRRR